MARIDGIDPAEVDGYTSKVLEAQAKTWGAPLLNHLVDDAYGFLSPASNGNGVFRPAVPCPTCSPRVKAIKAAHKTERELSALFGGANIPDYARSWSFETYPASGDRFALEESMAFAHRETARRALYLWGALGHGKTSLAVSIHRTFLDHGASGLYLRALQWMRLVNSGMRVTDRLRESWAELEVEGGRPRAPR